MYPVTTISLLLKTFSKLVFILFLLLSFFTVFSLVSHLNSFGNKEKIHPNS